MSAEHTDAEKLKSAEVTLATLASHVDETLAVVPESSTVAHARGYRAAMSDVKAILDARWLPDGQPVILKATS